MGETPLGLATDSMDKEMVILLLKKGGDPTIVPYEVKIRSIAGPLPTYDPLSSENKKCSKKTLRKGTQNEDVILPANSIRPFGLRPFVYGRSVYGRSVYGRKSSYANNFPKQKREYRRRSGSFEPS